MASYETEEQQVEALKKWWKDNGRSVIAGVMIGAGALLGWKGWNSYQAQQETLASEMFGEIQLAANRQQIDEVEQQAKTLRDDYSRTPYATLAALLLSKVYGEKENYTGAIENLDWVIKHSSQDALRDIARLRKARLLLSNKQTDEAKAILSEEFPEALQSLRMELQGDLYVVLGDKRAAYDAYSQAIASANETSGLEFLMMKKDNLGLSETVDG